MRAHAGASIGPALPWWREAAGMIRPRHWAIAIPVDTPPNVVPAG
jgi:hypothetical protein